MQPGEQTMFYHSNEATAAHDRLIPLGEVVATLRISRSTAYRLIEAKKMPQPVKIGARTFFSERELQSWIAGKLDARDVITHNQPLENAGL
jgi:predicted DNA-binding transcriptional regulator AlpA